MDILFWSGGKDAYLALEFYRQEYPDQNLKLLTTFSESRTLVPHQNIPVEHIEAQAAALNLEPILVPLPDNCPNEIYSDKVKQALKNQQNPVKHLVFGDWHLQDIRKWREQQFEALGYPCLFPIWEKPIGELLPVLLLKPVDVKISAVSEEWEKFIRVGEPYNQSFVRQLPKEIDPMGENGEFHTEITIKSGNEEKPGKQPLW